MRAGRVFIKKDRHSASKANSLAEYNSLVALVRELEEENAMLRLALLVQETRASSATDTEDCR